MISRVSRLSLALVGVLLSSLLFTACDDSSGYQVKIQGQVLNPSTEQSVDINQLRDINVCYTVYFKDSTGRKTTVNYQGKTIKLSSYDCHTFPVSLLGDDFQDGKFSALISFDKPYDAAEESKDWSESEYTPISVDLQARLRLKEELYPATFTLEYLSSELEFDCPVYQWHKPLAGTSALRLGNESDVYEAAESVSFEIDPFDPEAMYQNASNASGARDDNGQCRVTQADL